jgi:ectoine hydroxylase-related dioxygenase (phytanoyl-CoA dioxygenase family)
MQDFVEEVRVEGFAIIPDVLAENLRLELIAFVEGLPQTSGRRRGGDRGLGGTPPVQQLAASSAVRSLVDPVLGAQALLVRCILFDKVPDANWRVPWHQDLTIAVREKIDVAGYGPWSMKDGVPHVQPPVPILESMLAVRLHLDDCNESNGPLRVLPRSHRLGRIPEQQINQIVTTAAPVTCLVPAGDALLMRPLLLHASSPSAKPGHRRVIHLEFAAACLLGGLEWRPARPPTPAKDNAPASTAR